MAAWESDGTVQVSTRSGRDPWDRAHTLPVDRPAQLVDSPQVAIDAAGNATMVWQRQWSTIDGMHSATFVAFHADGGEWSTPMRPGTGDVVGPVSVSAGDAGDVVVVWGDYSTPHVLRHYVRRRSPAGVWTKAVALPVDADTPSFCSTAAIDGDGTPARRSRSGCACASCGEAHICDVTRLHRRQVPPLTRETVGYQACTLNYCLGRFPVTRAL